MLSTPDFKEKQIILALLSRGEILRFKNDNIIIEDKNGIKHQSSCYRLFALFIIGHTSITTGLLQRAKKFGFSIILLTHGLSHYGSWMSKVEGNVILRKKQYQYSKTEIAQHIITNKISQQIFALKKIRSKSRALKQAIVSLNEYKSRFPNSSFEIQDILGIEGISSRIYFKNMFDEMNWKGRKPRVKNDITNLLLDIGYTQLFNFIEALLNLYGFDIYQGVYHQVFYQRKSLVCDLVEPFRSLVDQRVRKAFKIDQVNEIDFQFINGQYRIFGKESKPYVSFLLKNLLNRKDDLFLYVQSYYRAFMQSKPIEEFPIFE